MARVKVPETPHLYNISYTSLRGVDYSETPTEVDRKHSPDMVNMISDDGGNPVKRHGWRKIRNYGQKILDIFTMNDSMYVASDTNIYDGEGNGILTGDIHNFTRIKMFGFDGKLCAYGTYDDGDGESSFFTVGNKIEDTTDITVPVIIISRKPDGSGGASLDSVNLLTGERAIQFLGDSTNTTYQLYPQNVRTEESYKYVKVTKVEVMDSNGNWKETTAYTKPSATTITGYDRNGKQISIQAYAPYITFNSAHAPVVTGQDNVRITFIQYNGNPASGVVPGATTGVIGLYSEWYTSLCEMCICKTYGYENNDRLFAVGKDNRVYYSDVGNPMNFPDDNYISITNTSKIVGLHRFDKYLVVITGDNEQESSVYFVSGKNLLSATGQQVTGFAVQSTAVELGAIAPNSFASILDEPLFLTRNGIFAISNHYATTRLAIRQRSIHINKKLLKEPNLDKAIACEWNNYLLLGINDKVYILDGRLSVKDSKNTTDFTYECYYWENIPAVKFCTLENELYFGDHEGNLCKFNTDVDNVTAYEDNGTLEGQTVSGGVAIPCRYSTPLDYDGYMNHYKTMNKKGNVVLLKPYQKSSSKIYASVDGGRRFLIKEGRTDTLDFSFIDWTNFPFASQSDVRSVVIRKKIKKYKALQLIVENDVIDEPLGIIGITKTFTIGNYIK